MINTSRRKLSYNLYILLSITVCITPLVVFEAVINPAQLSINDLILVFIPAILIFPALVAGIVYYMGAFVKCTRTTRDVEIGRRVREVKEDALGWLREKGFKIVEEKEGFIQATRGRRGLIKIYFELMLKGENGECSLHGEFYTKAGRGPERDLREKTFERPRKKGFKLMNEFLGFLKEG